MKINDPSLGALGTNGAGGAKGPERSQEITGRAQPNQVRERSKIEKDGVELSALSQGLRATEAESPERQARIDQLRKDVAAGRYQPDAAEVSRKIVEESLNDGKRGI